MACTTQYAGSDCTSPEGALPSTGFEFVGMVVLVAAVLALGALMRLATRDQ